MTVPTNVQPARKPAAKSEKCASCYAGITKHDRDGGNRAVVLRKGERVAVHADCVLPTDSY